jgi:flagellar biosynthesis protein FlhA
VQKVLQSLLREGVSIRDMLTILETLADRAPKTQSPEILTEFVRQSLARTITKQYASSDGKIYLMMLDQEIEEIIQQATQYVEEGITLALEPNLAQRILDTIQKGIDQFSVIQMQPILACLPTIRSQMRRLTEKFFPNLIVLSHNEIVPSTPIESIGIVRLSDVN